MSANVLIGLSNDIAIKFQNRRAKGIEVRIRCFESDFTYSLPFYPYSAILEL